MSNVNMQSMTENQKFYKYKVGKKWFTFDKTILEPEDLQIFDRANWQDKLKIITIYKDLKEVEDDTINVLTFKKENANKDKRRQEYTAKRDKIMDSIKELNKKQNKKETKEEATKQIEELQKNLKDLEIEYADVININTANTLNVASVNTLNLNNINKIKTAIKDTEETFNSVKNLLSNEDIDKFKTLFENLKDSNIETEGLNYVKELKNLIKDIKPNTLPEDLAKEIKEIKTKIETLTTSTEEQFKQLNDVINSKQIDKLIEITTNLKNDIPRITEEIYNNLNKTFNFKILYKLQQNIVKGVDFYYDIYDRQKKEFVNKLLTLDILKSKYVPFYSGNNQKTSTVYRYTKDRQTTSTVKNVFIYIGTTTTTNPLFENLISIYKEYNNIQTEGLNGVKEEEQTEEGQGFSQSARTQCGFLGLKTKKDFERDKQQIEQQFNEVRKEHEALKKEVEELKKEVERIKDSQPYQRTEPRRVFNPIDLSIQKQRLKRQTESLNGVKQEPTQNDLSYQLSKIMDKRREDIEPDYLTDDESEEWAAGLNDEDEILENIEVKPIAGSILADLKEDLKNYGLSLNFNIYKKNFNKDKRKGEGFREAKKIVDSTNNGTRYTDLKELYEDLYD